jgi:hypothetical protein
MLDDIPFEILYMDRLAPGVATIRARSQFTNYNIKMRRTRALVGTVVRKAWLKMPCNVVVRSRPAKVAVSTILVLEHRAERA